MQVGQYECVALDTGTVTVDGSEMFQSARPAAWERSFRPNGAGRVTLVVRCLLLRSENALVLVDCGCGSTLPAELAAAYGVDRSVSSLESGLKAAGVAPGDFTHVLLTHLHFDHAGGITRRVGSELALTFPNAAHLLQRAQLEAALRPCPEEAESFIAEDVALLASSDRLRLLDGPGEFLPGLEVDVAHGHTVGQQVLIVGDSRRPLLFSADVIPTSAHLQHPWFTAYDMDKRLAVREKRDLLARAADEHHLVVFDHDPLLAACTVERDGRSFTPGIRIEKWGQPPSSPH